MLSSVLSLTVLVTILTNMNYKRPGQNFAVSIMLAIDFQLQIDEDLMFIVKIIYKHSLEILWVQFQTTVYYNKASCNLFFLEEALTFSLLKKNKINALSVKHNRVKCNKMRYACTNQESHVVSNNYICVHILLVSDSSSKFRVEWTVLRLFPSGPGHLGWTCCFPSTTSALGF